MKLKVTSYTYDFVLPSYTMWCLLTLLAYLALGLLATTAVRQAAPSRSSKWPYFVLIWSVPIVGACYVLLRFRRSPQPPLL